MQIFMNSVILLTKNFLKPSVSNKIFLITNRNYCLAATNNVGKVQSDEKFKRLSSDEDAQLGALPYNQTVASKGKGYGITETITETEPKPTQCSLNIAVIGVPNAGKSTFINNLINHRVCPTSSKVHTTRKANKAIYTVGQTQLVFYDTPGLVTQREIKKHNLDRAFKSSYRHAVQHADVIAVLHDVSNNWTRNELHSTVIDTLKAYSSMPSILVLNKIDALKSKRVLLELIRKLTDNTLTSGHRQQQRTLKDSNVIEKEANQSGLKRDISWRHFSEVFLVSSITGDGLNQIHDFFISSAKPRSWQHSREIFTDETPESLIVDSVRARLLDYLPQEIPYNLECAMEYYSVEKNTIYASVIVTCPSPRIERLICGESNGKLRQITERVISDLVETFGVPISLTIATKNKKEKKV